MIHIRQGVFETNSSSSHSIVVRRPTSTLGLTKQKKGWSECGYIDGKGDMHVYKSHFGIGFSVLTSWMDKMIYALAEFNDDENEMNRIVDVMKRRHPEFKTLDFDRYTSDMWGDGRFGSIDHQSQGLLRSALAGEDIAVEDLIDDDKYVIVIDSDECCYLEQIEIAGLLDKNAIERQYPEDE